MPMEPKLRAHLIKLFEGYSFHAGGSYATLSARIAGDARFYEKLLAQEGAFSVSRYDLVVARFAECWPSNLMWPPEIERISIKDVPVRPRKPRGKRPAAADDAAEHQQSETGEVDG